MAGTVSFFPTKNLGGFGDGGLILTDQDALAGRLRMLRVHGGVSGGRYDAVGVNSRLDSMQAAVLHAKLPRLAGWTEARRANAATYDELLAGVPGVRRPRVLTGNFHTFHQYTIRARERDRSGTTCAGGESRPGCTTRDHSTCSPVSPNSGIAPGICRWPKPHAETW